MGKGTLGVTHIKMYEEMIERRFSPIITVLNARNKSVDREIATQVKKDLGIYDLMAEKEAIMLRLKEIERDLVSYTEKEYGYVNGKYGTLPSLLEREITRRVEEKNKPLCEIKKIKAEMLDEIRLSTAGTEVKAIFEKMDKILDAKMAEAKQLLPPGIDADQLLLKEAMEDDE